MNPSNLRTHFLLIPLVVGILATALYGQEKVKIVDEAPRIEVCFVLDTTGSMGGLIQGAKDKIWSIANELATSKPAPKIKFGLVGYRDRGDEYITQITDLTEDLDTIHTKLNAFGAGGGGDTPESVNQSLHESVTQMAWSTDDEVLKIIFLVGDAPPHMDYDEVQYPAICAMALKKDLVINTIQCGSISSTTPIWREIAAKANGKFTAIQQSGGTIAIATPQDELISALNIKLNGTVISYGSAATHRLSQSNIASNQSSKAESIADRANFYSLFRGSGGKEGRAGKVIGGKDDLVEQIMNSEIELSAIDKSKLPADLKDLPIAEQKNAIEQKIADRKKLQTQMDALVKQRSEFIQAEKAKSTAAGEEDSFDMQVKDMIREQGKSKGIKFSK